MGTWVWARALGVAGLLGAGTAQAGPPCAVTSVELDPKTVVARVGGKPITVAEVDAHGAQALCQARVEAREKLDEARQAALARLIDERLLTEEAKRRQLAGPEALLERVMAELPPTTEEAVQAFYREYQDRMQGAALEEVAPKIREVLGQQARAARYGALVGGLRAASAVVEDYPPVRVPVEAKGPSRGPAGAPVTIVMFSDYECPYCARGAESMAAVQARYPKEVRLVYRDYPLGFHRNAVPAAVAARCAGVQGRYFEMHDKLYAEQQGLDAASYLKHVKALGLDAEAFTRCMSDPAQAAAVQADLEAGSAAGVQGTPAFFINGVRVSGAQPPEAFAAIIDRELARGGAKGKAAPVK